VKYPAHRLSLTSSLKSETATSLPAGFFQPFEFVLPGEPNWTFPFTINQHLSIIRNFKDSSRIIHYKSAALFVSLLPEIERVRRNLLWTGWVAPAL